MFRVFRPFGVLGGTLATAAGVHFPVMAHSEPEQPVSPTKALPIFRKGQVSAHTTPETGVWVIYKEGVYDITTFVQNHPGGADKIMLAAGKSVEPYWRVYRQHYNSKLPLELLGPMRIGTLHPEDVAANNAARDLSDPYSGDPDVSPIMDVLQAKPINAQAPTSLIAQEFITPEPLWFVRNHHPVPNIDPKDYRLNILDENGAVLKSYSLDELKRKFKPTTITSTIQCGGNRRKEMNNVEKTAGTPWNISAISNATWTGYRLTDIIKDASSKSKRFKSTSLETLEERYKHVVFGAAEGMQASIPSEKALSKKQDVLLAVDMNGEPLTPAHGYPLRAVVPGTVGVRNVKWCTDVTLSMEEATGPWQRGMAYKGFGPSTKSLSGIDVESIPSLQEQPVTSAIAMPKPGDTMCPGSNTIKGYAYSGAGRSIVRVDVSVDGGRTWQPAELQEGKEQKRGKAWAWTLWEADVVLPTPTPIDLGYDLDDHKIRAPGEKKRRRNRGTLPVEIIVKATDSGYNTQPDSVKGIWNLRGINNNAWHRVDITVQEDDNDDDEDDYLESGDLPDAPTLEEYEKRDGWCP